MYTGIEVAPSERVRAVWILFLLVACSESPSPPVERAREAPTRPPCVEEWTPVKDGVEYRMHDCELHLVRVDPGRARIDAVLQPNSTARAVAGAGTFAINANFFDEQFRPLGVVLSSRKELNPPHPVSWQAVFFVDGKGRPDIVPIKRWKDARKTAVTAVQCGPRLVIKGERNQVAKADPDWRSGVCIDRKDKVVFFATAPETQLDVHQMVDRAVALGCRDALLFDGGPSTQMYLRREGGEVEVSGDKRVPAYVVVR